MQACRTREPFIAPICPGRLPKAKRVAGLSILLIGSPPQPKDHVCFSVFNIVYGGEHPTRPDLNRPVDAFFHVALAAGWFGGVSPFPFSPASVITRRVAFPKNGTMTDPSRRHPSDMVRPVLYGPRDWNGIHGYLFLAPPESLGGLYGNHLVYLWHANGADYIFSLHAWEPLAQAAMTLHSLINTIPSDQPHVHAPPGCREVKDGQ